MQPKHHYSLQGHLVTAEPVGFGWWFLQDVGGCDHLDHLPSWAVSPDGTIYQSSAGGAYVQGYPIGTVAELLHTADGSLQELLLQPSAFEKAFDGCMREV